jgi:two-component system, LuxR family, sensor kinase FixL
MVAINIADTGPGIAPEIASQLFEPFVTTKAQGMGVGLSISRTIIEAHDGRLSVESSPGKGAVFRFTLRAMNERDLNDAG